MADVTINFNALPLFRADGSPVRLGSVHSGPLVLVFLRHLA